MPTADTHSSDDRLPLCAFCGKPMTLVNIRELAEKLGYRIDEDGPQYVLECCGHERLIDDPIEFQRAIDLLKRHYGRS